MDSSYACMRMTGLQSVIRDRTCGRAWKRVNDVLLGGSAHDTKRLWRGHHLRRVTNANSKLARQNPHNV